MRLVLSLLLSGSAALACAWPAASQAATALQPFSASYEAWYGGKPAGTATMRVSHDGVARWRVDDGAEVKAGDLVAVMEAMKMETQVLAHADGRVARKVEAGASVAAGGVIARIG